MAKAKTKLQRDRERTQAYEKHVLEAAAEWRATRDAEHPPSLRFLAAKHNVSKTTIQACVLGRLSKAQSNALRGYLSPAEEDVVVTYLIDAAEQGFPDGHLCLLMRVNRIFQAKCQDPDHRVSRMWVNWFLARHPRLALYWSTSLATVRGGAANPAVIDHWYQLLQDTIDKYGIDWDTRLSAALQVTTYWRGRETSPNHTLRWQ